MESGRRRFLPCPHPLTCCPGRQDQRLPYLLLSNPLYSFLRSQYLRSLPYSDLPNLHTGNKSSAWQTGWHTPICASLQLSPHWPAFCSLCHVPSCLVALSGQYLPPGMLFTYFLPASQLSRHIVQSYSFFRAQVKRLLSQ